MATFTYIPDFGAQKDRKPTVKVVRFGDGYEARFNTGLNSFPDVWNLSFSQREKAEADSIDDFLEARSGVEAFDWTPPDATTSIKVVCEGWTRRIEKHNRYTIVASFRRVYEP